MRWVVVALAVGACALGCGRIGYGSAPADDGAVDDGATDDGATDDGAPDAAAACRFRSLGMGITHGCAVNAIGDVYCWGANDAGVVTGSAGADYVPTPTRVSLPEPVVEVAAGRLTTCARTEQGALYCWGKDLSSGTAFSQPTRVDLGTPVKAIRLGTVFACAVVGADDHVECWGDNAVGQLGAPAPAVESSPTPLVVADTDGTVALTVGHAGACVRRTGDRARCWGFNPSGQLALGNEIRIAPPTDNAALASYERIALSGRHGCGLDGGVVRCWGRNGLGETGGASFAISVPDVPLRADVADVSTMARATCALDLDGDVGCWGQNRAGELGQGDLRPRNMVTAVATLSGVQAIAAGAHHVCAERGGELWCWGEDVAGQLGRGTRGVAAVPTRVASTLGAIADVAVLDQAVCVRTVAGEVWCWGDNEVRKLGRDNIEGSATPVRVLGGALGLAGTEDHACSWDANGLTCWGSGFHGNGPWSNYGTPVLTVAATSITSVAIGFDFTCAVSSAGTQCWGANTHRQLGSAASDPSLTPVTVTAPAFAQIVAGFDHACGRTAAGAVHCWGQSASGQAGGGPGPGSIVATPTVVAMPGDATVTQLAAGRIHTCALSGDGRVFCWGEAESGQLGIQSQTDIATPRQVALPATATAVFARFDTSCARLSDGRTQCWGANARSSSGTGDDQGGAAPRAFGTVDAVQLAGGYELSCAVDTAGALWCAGSGSRGALGPDFLTATPMLADVPCR